MKILKLTIIVLFIFCKGVAGQDLKNFVQEPDTSRIMAFQKTIDRHFDSNWVLKSIKRKDIDHYKQGVVIEWQKDEGERSTIRTYSYNERSMLYNAHEQRLLRDSLQCQGFIHYKADAVDYIELVYVERSTLKKTLSLEGNFEFQVKYYEFETYNSGKIECIYQTRWIHHYDDLFLEKYKGKVTLVQGYDCLHLISGNKKNR